jgi:hypothetical protein
MIRCLLHADILLGLIFNREDGGDVPSKRRCASTGIHSVISHKIELFMLLLHHEDQLVNVDSGNSILLF